MVTLKEALKNKIPEEEIPTSFDIIGNIAIFSKLTNNKKKQKLIANTLLNLNKNITTILLKSNKIMGKYRLAKYKFLAGKKITETTYKENNCLFNLDVKKCYFNTRLSNERARISKQVKFNETILVMFSGIAVYPIVISKNSKAKEIYAIEANPIAHSYAQKNLVLNKVSNIKLLKGDVKKILPKIKIKFDRIIMPAPKNAEQYLNLIKNKLKRNTIIHFYDFSQEKDFPQESINRIKKYFDRIKILNTIKCGNVSPYNYRVCIDFQVL